MKRVFILFAAMQGLMTMTMTMTAQAGPWARDAGDVFLSFAVMGEDARDDLFMGQIQPETSRVLYGEIGLGRRLTFGLDLMQGEVSEQAIGFLRYTLTPPDATWQFAVDLGAGTRAVTDVGESSMARLAISAGRGFGVGNGRLWFLPVAHQGGWLTFEARAMQDMTLDQLIWQAEATVGLSLSDRISFISTLKVEEWPDADSVVSYLPALVYDIRTGTSVQLGGRVSDGGADVMGLQLGLWQQF